MRRNQLWIETVALGTSVACALGLLIATLGAAVVAVGGQQESAQTTQSVAPQQQAREGMVTCSRCSKHSASLGKAAAGCTRECIRLGATFALVDGEKTYQLEGNLVAIKNVAGQRARVVGVVRGNKIQVASVTTVS